MALLSEAIRSISVQRLRSTLFQFNTSPSPDCPSTHYHHGRRRISSTYHYSPPPVRRRFVGKRAAVGQHHKTNGPSALTGSLRVISSSRFLIQYTFYLLLRKQARVGTAVHCKVSVFSIHAIRQSFEESLV